MGVVSALCVLFALMSALGTIWSLMLVFFLSLILAHVMGNSLGTKLCSRPSRQASPLVAQLGNLESFEVAGPRRLAEHSGLNRATIAMTLGGAIVGGAVGGTGLAATYPGASAGAVALGIISSAVLGGFFGFTASTFFSVARAALREALSEPTMRHPAAPAPR